MKNKMLISFFVFSIILLFVIQNCSEKDQQLPTTINIEAESFKNASGDIKILDLENGNKVVANLKKSDWLAYEVNVNTPGRYKCEIKLSSDSNLPGSCWIEDYYDNSDGRTYNITAGIEVPATKKGGAYSAVSKDGSPLNTGLHKMKLHLESDSINVDWIKFTLMRKHQITPDTLVQNTDGMKWKLVWSDEFDGSGLIDTKKWTYDIGNWGWGNNEPQYYTENRIENARQENGNLIIEARKDDMGQSWTSARLTTRGKVSFIYGKIEFRAKVPAGDGTWAAGWTLGDAYRDEISWPYCGEIDILECIGKEIDDETGDGINHASCHTRAYYHKQQNQITSVLPVKNMRDEFHTYAIEWTEKKIDAFVDGQKYYTYDKNADELEWPFNKPQNIIINLAMGGGMGGSIDENISSQKLIVDYVRAYEKN